MKIRDLINQLQKMDQEIDVFVSERDNFLNYSIPVEIEEDVGEPVPVQVKKLEDILKQETMKNLPGVKSIKFR